MRFDLTVTSLLPNVVLVVNVFSSSSASLRMAIFTAENLTFFLNSFSSSGMSCSARAALFTIPRLSASWRNGFRSMIFRTWCAIVTILLF